PGRPVVRLGATIARTEADTLRKTGPFPPAVVTEKGGEPAIRPDRIADAWELAAPQRDRLDPEKLQKILAAIPDLWVEEFVNDARKDGLGKPERTLTITPAKGEKVTVLFGAVARTATRDETVASPPPMPGLPPFPMT